MRLRHLLLTILFALLPVASWGAVVCGAETSTSGAPPADPLTLVATPDAGSDRVWIIHASLRESDADNGVVNGVTSSAGGTFTLYGNNVETGGTDILSYIFYSTDFVDGSQTLSVDYTVSTPAQGFIAQYVCTGVRTSNPWFGAATTGQGTSTTITLSVPCATGSLAVDAFALNGIVGSPTVGADQTEMYNVNINADNFDSGGSTEAGASTNTMTWGTTSSIWGAVGGCLVPPDGSALRRRTF